MLKLFIATLFLFISCNSFAAAVPTREILWHKVNGMGDENTVVYVDFKSVRRMNDEAGEFGYGLVAYQMNNPALVKFDDGSKQVTTLVRHYMVACNKNKVSSMADYWFNTGKLPIVGDTPVMAFDFEIKDMKILPISDKNPIYKILCAKYI